MKLLFDQNLSDTLVSRLSDLFPHSAHVKDFSLTHAGDDLIWSRAREQGFVIVSKDGDFQQRSLLFGAPPKVVWLRVGNCPTNRIETLIREHSVTLHTFEADPEQSLLVLS
jgi:predicted nuclease of predicted toxin-antitoxin system